jgi:predicted phosphodiesterase
MFNGRLMRLALLSDVHANREALEATLRDAALRRADGVLCLGDIVGYNADPAECVRLLWEAGAVCVAGNHDRAVTGLLSTDGFSLIAARAVD